MLKRLNIITIIILFIWISFFPAPIQDKYSVATKIFLGLSFIALLFRKRASLFKFSDFPLWFFLIAISLNIFFAQRSSTAFKTYLDLAIPLFLIYYLISESISFGPKSNFLIKTISLASIFVALGGILESLFAFNLLYEYFIENPYYQRYITNFGRPMSTQFNPAPLGTYLLASLPFNFLLFRQNKGIQRLLGALGVIVGVAVIILTFSRGVFLGFIAMLVFYLLMKKQYRLLISFVILLFIFILVCSYLPYPFQRFGLGWIISECNGILSFYRFDRCLMVQRILTDHPLVGLGFQHIRLRFFEYYPYQESLPYEFMIADNMYLTLLGETGIVGFLGFLVFILSLFRKGWKKMRALKGLPEIKEQLLLIFSAFIGLLVNMGAYELFYWPNQFLYFCIFCGCIEAFWRDREG